jgi:hypothetical protein
MVTEANRNGKWQIEAWDKAWDKVRAPSRRSSEGQGQGVGQGQGAVSSRLSIATREIMHIHRHPGSQSHHRPHRLHACPM